MPATTTELSAFSCSFPGVDYGAFFRHKSNLKNLNPSQRQAVQHLGSPLLVLAGAGSGKTRVITRKIAWLIRERAVDPTAITAVTFTNKAAREMKERVRTELQGEKIRGLTVSTFHSLGLRILREELELAELRKGFSILDPRDVLAVVGDLLRTEGGAGEELAQAVSHRISSWKNAGLGPQQLVTEGTSPVDNTAVRLYPGYERYLRACNSVDLDDLVLLPTRLLGENDPALLRWRQRMRYLLVDEYQDTNGAQYRLVKLLAGEGRGLTAVGDDDQSIYAWRGARPENLMQLQVDFADLKTIKLEQNYRSAGRILKLANSLIANNPRPFEKKLWSRLGYGDTVRVLTARNDEHEAERVVSELLHCQFRFRAKPCDFAILYRSNHQARILEKKLREMRVPYRVSGGTSFFDRSEIRDVMSYLRLLTNPGDDSALLRVVNTPRRGVGPATLEQLAKLAGERRQSLFDTLFEPGLEQRLRPQPFSVLRRFGQRMVELADSAERGDPLATVDTLLAEIGYRQWLFDSDNEISAQRRWENVSELLEWLRHMAQNATDDAGLSDLVGQLMLRDILDRDEDEADTDQVSLMTLHAAKGLEFDYLFITGVEEEILPHRNALDTGSVEEERRLFYVGITRARRKLVLSHAQKRRRFGEQLTCEPSRFLAELPAEDLEFETTAGDSTSDKSVGHAHLANIRAMLGRN